MDSHDDLSVRQRVFEILKKYPNLKAKAMQAIIPEVQRKGKKQLDYIRHLRAEWIHDYKHNPYASLSEKEFAYIAGIIDGEGHANIITQRPKCKIGCVHGEWFTLRISIANTNKGIVEWLQRRLGGSISTQNHDGCKPCYSLQLNAKRVRWLVPKILPYSVGKREELTLLIRAFPLIQAGKRQDHYPEVKQLQQAIRVNHGRQGRRRLGFVRK